MAETVFVLGLQQPLLKKVGVLLGRATGLPVWSRDAFAAKIETMGPLTRSRLQEALEEDVESFLRENRGTGILADSLLWRVVARRPRASFKILQIVQDGRVQVVTDMHQHRAGCGNVYREGLGENAMNPNTVFRSAARAVGADLDEDLRARPDKEDPFAAQWAGSSREVMAAWGWSYVHRQIRHAEAAARVILKVEDAPGADWAMIVSRLGLPGEDFFVDESVFDHLLHEAPLKPFSSWLAWTERQREMFEYVAGSEMHEFGYFRSEHDRWKPVGYGEIWSREDKGQAWYEWMYASRKDCHDFFQRRYTALTSGEVVGSVLEYGCARGLGYADFFAGTTYLGVDISPSNIAACRSTWPGRGRSFMCEDFTSLRTSEKFDFVFSSGTIDNVHDVRGFLLSMVANSRRRIWLSYTRGWFRELDDNRYHYNVEDGCFYIDISPAWIKNYLELNGCRDVRVYSFLRGEGLKTRSYETIVEAMVPNG